MKRIKLWMAIVGRKWAADKRLTAGEAWAVCRIIHPKTTGDSVCPRNS